MHSRRCTHELPMRRQSSHPSLLGVTSSTWSRWVQVWLIACSCSSGATRSVGSAECHRVASMDCTGTTHPRMTTGGSAVPPDVVDVEGPGSTDLVHADALRVAPVRTLPLQVAEELVFVRTPFAVIGAEDDDVVDTSVPEKLRVLGDFGPIVPADALGEELRVEPRVVLHELIHPDLAVVRSQNAVRRAGIELARLYEGEQLGVGFPIEGAPGVFGFERPSQDDVREQQGEAHGSRKARGHS